MSVLIERLSDSLEVFGEPILIEDEPAQAFVRVYSAAEARLYLEEAVITAASRPIRGFFVLADTVAAIGNTIEWLGETYEIAFIRRYRISGADVGLGLIAVLP
ncbi:MAG: hypothetical protein JNK63_03545 [Chthonomonas sp.]|nr:hypothetical protein [Chthonomonas sp.]